MFAEAISLFFLIFTSLFGIAALIRLLFSALFEKSAGRLLSVLPAGGREDGLECTLRGILARSERPVAVVDCGLDEDARELVLRLQKHFDRLVLLPPEELAGWVAQQQNTADDTPNG